MVEDSSQFSHTQAPSGDQLSLVWQGDERWLALAAS
jgi:hypothetical protein